MLGVGLGTAGSIHGRKVVASLKVVGRAGLDVRDAGIHGRKVVASLKDDDRLRPV